MASYQEIVDAAKSSIREVTPADLAGIGSESTVIDIREADEVAAGVIPGARWVSRGILEREILALVPDPDESVVLYCGGGSRSALATASLNGMGYPNVASLAGGFSRWRDEGRDIEPLGGLRIDQRSRYARHLVLPEVGESGQQTLLDSKVLLVGAGGLGSPAAMYLGAAGVGTIGIVDSDVVDTSNLQRQILHTVDRIGDSKVESAGQTIKSLNPDVKVIPHSERLGAHNVLDLIKGYDVVVDGADNFPTRYLLNDAALHVGIPVVHGSVLRFEGQATVFKPYAGPCYRCIFPQPPPPELAPSCAEAGVLGVLPGIIGSIQALEAIKVILDIGDTLQGRLLVYDALDQQFTELKVARDPQCPACADEAHPPVIVEYDQYCVPAPR